MGFLLFDIREYNAYRYSNGLLKMRQQGAATIGQDEASCVVYGMPRAAYEKGAVERQLPLSGIASMITTVAHGQGRR